MFLFDVSILDCILCEIPFLSMTFSHNNLFSKPSPIIDYLKLVTNMSKRSEEIIRLRDVLTKIPGVTKILWTEMCAIVHDRLEKGKVRSIFFLANNARAHILPTNQGIRIPKFARFTFLKKARQVRICLFEGPFKKGLRAKELNRPEEVSCSD